MESKKKRATTVYIDGERLRAELEKRQLKQTIVSCQIGYEASYLNKCITFNKIARPAINLLQINYGISFDDYKRIEEETKEPQMVEVVQQIGFSEEEQRILYKIIYSAVYEAMKRALSE